MSPRRSSESGLPGWDLLRHGGLLCDTPRLEGLSPLKAPPLPPFVESRLRERGAALLEGAGGAAPFVAFVLSEVCGWTGGSRVPKVEGRRALSGKVRKPRQLWTGAKGARLPVFLDESGSLRTRSGRDSVNGALEWLRAGREPLALITNGRCWRLLFAGLDHEAWCEWDVERWFEEGALSPQVTAFRTLLSPALWTPEGDSAAPPLLRAIRDTRRGQAEVSEQLGERVRQAVELLIRAHGTPLKELGGHPPDLYRAACRVVMRLVVILYAESRELLPRENALYDAAYGLGGLGERLEREDPRALAERFAAWPRVLALFRLVREGSWHPELPVTAYGGDLFAPGRADSSDGLSRALAVFESACFGQEPVFPDREVHEMLRLLTRTTVRLRQGRGSVRVSAPVDFSDLSSEYIGVLYEGLLDYELKTAPADDPVLFLPVGDQPALPLSRLEAMDDAALRRLFSALKKPAAAADGGEEAPPADAAAADEEAPEKASSGYRGRAELWARRAVLAAGLARRRRGRDTPERRLAHEREVGAAARRLLARLVPPGEWYLARWGGTRKGSGSFFTRTGLAVPTVQRTLRPLAYDPPAGADGSPDPGAPPARWIPKQPQRILGLTVCDPACGSGAFVLAALRFLTDALYASLSHHDRIESDGERALVRLLGMDGGDGGSDLGEELIPCRREDEGFEPRLRALLRRHVVERCIYAVDLDPLAVELCRLSLWIETMDRELPFGFLDHKIRCGNSLIGAWFDRYRHYPAMAWKRQSGDENHANGVHFEKSARAKKLKAFVEDKLKPDLRELLGGRTLFREDQLAKASATHDEAQRTLEALHALPVRDPAALARRYREEFLGSPARRLLKEAMDLWCACWFWPADELESAPIPTAFDEPPEETRKGAARIAAEMRFFHWELEFPDVFRAAGAGFDAVVGNPPWDIAKPNSMEFFSDLDPLYRSYGKQQALRKQREYFADPEAERRWLDYAARFRAQSNFMSCAANPCGDPEEGGDRFSIARGRRSADLHARWRAARRGRGYCDPEHPFRHQGSADLNLYKLFLETAHALLKPSGRLGFLVPSGLYSDHGTRAIRDLFLGRCRWEWLFGIENRERIFPIHRSYKFNPLIVERGGATDAIRAAFMRRDVGDWGRAEELTIPYTRAQVERFSPKSRAILEIQSRRDLEILEKIYGNSVLLGDDGPDGWGIRYGTEFHMTNDSRLFPPRPEWEAKGYRPDEYSRWLLGDWRPLGELWAKLGVDPAAGPRCAPPPYDRLPVARTDIPPGAALSRDGEAWIREEDVEDTALPVYVGKMIYVGDWAAATARDGRSGRCDPDPDFLLGAADLRHDPRVGSRLVFRDISNATNERSFVSALVPGLFPCGNKTPLLKSSVGDLPRTLELCALLVAFAFDWSVRQRMSGTTLNWHIVESLAVPAPPDAVLALSTHAAQRFLCGVQFAAEWLRLATTTRRPRLYSHSRHERLRLAAMLDAAAAAILGLEMSDLRHVFDGCDHPRGGAHDCAPKGLWRVDKEKDPELRHTVLTLIAFHDLEGQIAAAGGARQRGIEGFLNQNDGEGWMLPETLRLADYGLGHDERARHPQPVASRLGPRSFVWQLAQSAQESWRECHLHARNLLGAEGYAQLLRSLPEGRERDDTPSRYALPAPKAGDLPWAAERRVAYRTARPKKADAPNLFE